MSGDRFRSAMAGIVGAVMPHKLFGVYEFKVVTGDTESADMQPTEPDVDDALPPLVKVKTYTSAAGELVTYAPGSLVLVSFVNGNPGRPLIVSRDASKPALEYSLSVNGDVSIECVNASITASVKATVSAPMVQLGSGAPALPVSRITDTCQAGPFPGVLTGGSAKVSST